MSDIDDQVGYTSESLRMLESKEGQLNAIFACFGSAAQRSQFFEVALGKFLLTYNTICKKSLTLWDLEAIETKLHKKNDGGITYGIQNDSMIEQCLDNALQKRNFLIHDFFRQRQEKFHTEKGRMDMLAELADIENELKRATDSTNGMRVAMSEALGLEDGGKGPPKKDWDYLKKNRPAQPPKSRD